MLLRQMRRAETASQADRQAASRQADRQTMGTCSSDSETRQSLKLGLREGFSVPAPRGKLGRLQLFSALPCCLASSEDASDAVRCKTGSAL